MLEELDRPALKAFPGEPYEYCECRLRRVGIDYDAHYYSVPYRFARAEVNARLTALDLEISFKGERITGHLRKSGNRKHTTIPEHMPSSHRRYAGWTIERIREDAHKIGPATAAERAIEIGARTYGSVKSIVDNKLDRRPAPKRVGETAPILRPNIRDSRYYH